MSSTNDPDAAVWGRAAGRLGGCLWLVVAGLRFLFVAGAAGVGIDASLVLLPLLLVPLAVAVVVFVGGDRVSVLLLSAVAGVANAALGAWNYFRAAAFEQANPGSVEISGGEFVATGPDHGATVTSRFRMPSRGFFAAWEAELTRIRGR